MVLPRRKPEDRGKDVLYIHDTIEVFAATLPELHRTYQDLIVPELHPNRLKELKRAIVKYLSVSSDAGAEAVVIGRGQGRSLTLEDLVELCAYGFREIFKST